MADDEILRRLDEHAARSNEIMARNDKTMARGNEIMARNDKTMARGNEIMARNDKTMVEFRQAMAEHHQAMQDIRYELKQMSMRGERVAQGFIDELQEHRGVLRDLVAENGAQRQALFAILDQMRGGPPPAGA
jgi:predicted ester cyclase